MHKIQFLPNTAYRRQYVISQKGNKANPQKGIKDFQESTISATASHSHFISFGISTSAFKLIQHADMHCPSCGKKIMIQKQYDAFKAMLTSIPESKMIEFLKAYKGHLPDFIESIFDEIVVISEKNPEYDLQTILSIMRKKELPKLQIKQMSTVEEMKHIVAKKLSGQEQKEVSDFLNASIKRILKSSMDKKYFSRKDFLGKVYSLEVKNQVVKDELISTAEGLSRSVDSRSAWVIKYSGYDKNGGKRSNREIAESLLTPSVVNVDHLLAASLGGKNSMTNYVTMHSLCNSLKANKNLPKWVSEDYDRLQYFREYLNDAQRLVNNDKLPNKYKSYPIDIYNHFNKLLYGANYSSLK